MACCRPVGPGCASELARRLRSFDFCGDCNPDRGVEAVFYRCPQPRPAPPCGAPVPREAQR